MKTTAILILNWNGAGLTLECLSSLKKVHGDHIKKLVIDNGSTDGSTEKIHQQFPEIEILKLDKNYGFGGGNNRGFMHAMELWNPAYCIFLNNDTTVDPGFVKELLTPIEEHSDIHCTVPKIYFYDKPDLLWYAGGRINFWLGKTWHRGIRELDSDSFNLMEETEYATGCCLCIRSNVYKSLGGFSSSYKMYAEDADLSLRIRSKGGAIMYCPRSIIMHKVSASVGGLFSLKKIIRKTRGNLQLLLDYANWYHWPTIIAYLPVRLVVGISKYIRLRD